MKTISVLGSTGSIGTQTLDVVRSNGDIRVSALAAKSNITLLEQQIREFHPSLACVWDEKKAEELKVSLADTSVKIVSGMDGLIEAAVIKDADLVVMALVGMIGIRPAIAAIKAGKDIALANKETLVCAGHIIMPLARQMNVKILPVDSEHSAIFQCLNGERDNRIDKIILTASGGPFRGMTKEEMAHVTPEDALKHPNWSMGKKVTIDSSTLANKGLEVMEARWLFGVDVDQVIVVIQPKSVVHSMVQFMDGAVIAQLGVPDMKLPIQYALYYPERRYLAGEKLDFYSLGKIEFERPDLVNFNALALAYEAGRTGGTMPTVFNAANEYAVNLFLDGRIPFLRITEMIEEAMRSHKVIEDPSVDEILETERETRERLA